MAGSAGALPGLLLFRGRITDSKSAKFAGSGIAIYLVGNLATYITGYLFQPVFAKKGGGLLYN